MGVTVDLQWIMLPTTVEVLTGISIDSTFDELNTERLQLVHQIIHGRGMIAQS